jgi:urease accessory protein
VTAVLPLSGAALATDSRSGSRRADGAVEVAFGSGRSGTALVRLYQQTPLRALFPRPEPGDLPLAVLANTGGGVVGGDRLAVTVEAGAGAAALVAGQAAEKIYRSTGADSRIDTRLVVGPGGWLEWLPQETILFDGARLRRSLTIEVAPGGRLLAGELLVFGRTARGERFTRGLLHEVWRVRRGGRLAWAEALRLDGDPAAPLAAAAGFAGAVAMATVVYAGDDAGTVLGDARGLLADGRGRAAATMVNGLLVARFLAADGAALRADVGRYRAGLRAMLAGLPRRLPRLWYV